MILLTGQACSGQAKPLPKHYLYGQYKLQATTIKQSRNTARSNFSGAVIILISFRSILLRPTGTDQPRSLLI